MESALSRLDRDFWQAYDESRIMTFLSEILGHQGNPQGRSPEPIGKGAHFSCYRLKAQPLDLAVKVSRDKEPGLKGKSASERKKWRQALAKLSGVPGPLIPPMKLLNYLDKDIVVMPAGYPLDHSKTALVAQSLQATIKALKANDLELRDAPQILSCQNTPFIYDWSDLYIVGDLLTPQGWDNELGHL